MRHPSRVRVRTHTHTQTHTHNMRQAPLRQIRTARLHFAAEGRCPPRNALSTEQHACISDACTVTNSHARRHVFGTGTCSKTSAPNCSIRLVMRSFPAVPWLTSRCFPANGKLVIGLRAHCRVCYVHVRVRVRALSCRRAHVCMNVCVCVCV